MKRGISTALLLAALMAGFAAPGAAQVAMIHGKLEDDRGKPIAGFPVIFERKDGGKAPYSSNIGFTSESGEFNIAIDQPGEYTAKLPGLADDAAGSYELAPEAMQIDTRKSPNTDIGTIHLQMR